MNEPRRDGGDHVQSHFGHVKLFPESRYVYFPQPIRYGSPVLCSAICCPLWMSVVTPLIRFHILTTRVFQISPFRFPTFPGRLRGLVPLRPLEARFTLLPHASQESPCRAWRRVSVAQGVWHSESVTILFTLNPGPYCSPVCHHKSGIYGVRDHNLG
jgi:hypothetical protein